MHELYYFGAWGGYGHYLWTPRGARIWHSATPWSLDGWLAGDPALMDPRRGGWGGWAPDHQPEGRVRLHHRDGWTAIAFWDRSEDERYNSNSVFIARGVYDAATMVALFEATFPIVYARITARFPLVLPPGEDFA